MLTVMLTLVPIFGIMCLGAWAESSRLLIKETAVVINQYVYTFALPILLFYVMARLNTEYIAWQPVAAFVVGMVISQIIATYVTRFYGRSHQEATAAGLAACFPNSAFMGIPIIMLIFPQNLEAEIYAGIAALAPTFSIIYADTSLALQNTQKSNFLKTLYNIYRIITHNPPTIGAGLGLAVSMSGFTLPSPIATASQMLANTAAPCALFCMGMSLSAQISQWSQSIKLQKHKQSAKKQRYFMQTSLIIIKLILEPTLVYFCCKALNVEGVALMVMTIVSALPTAVTCYVVAEWHHVFTEDCIILLIINTLLSCLTIPFVIALLI